MGLDINLLTGLIPQLVEQLRMGCICSASDNHDNDSLPASTSDSCDVHHSSESTSTPSEPYPWIKSTSTPPYPWINLTHDQANGNLKRYLEDLLTKKLAFPIPEAEVCDTCTCIRDAVEEIVGRILTEVEKCDDRFKVREILKVGSFYDGTTICYPDEFDYIAVFDWDSLAVGRNLELRSTNDNYIAFVDYKASVPFVYYDVVSYHLNESVKRLRNKKMHKVVMAHGKLEITNDSDVGDQCVVVNGPAATLSLYWNDSHGISIDITPAIRTSNVQNVSDLHANMVQYEKFYQTPLCNGALLLIIKHNDVFFKIAFTETEATIVQKQFSQKHRDVLKVLKYLHPRFLPPQCLQPDMISAGPIISSYVLKLTVINHHNTCSHDESDSISHCLITVLQDLLTHYMYLLDEPPGLHVEPVILDQISWKYPRDILDEVRHDYRHYRELVDIQIKKLNDLLVIADNKMSYSFDECRVFPITPHYENR